MSIPRIPFQNIKEATKNFKTVIKKDANVRVYKGELSLYGKLTTVTIERIHIMFPLFWYGEVWRMLLSEINLQPSVYEHSNILSLLGSCLGKDERTLIYEYAEHGNLNDYLNTNRPLTWMERLNICIDAARGLDHLHKNSVSHGDINSSNIALGQNLKAMIENLELSKMWTNDRPYKLEMDRIESRGIKGVVTAMLPFLYSKVPPISLIHDKNKVRDVSAFGQVLFDVLCGQSPAKLAKSYYKNGRLYEIIDVNLKNDQVDLDSLNSFSEIAYQCMKSDCKQRPSMGLVVKKLETLKFQAGIHLQVQDAKHLKIPLEDILSATKNFDKSHLIGKGGYGEVYKAKLKIKSKDELLEMPNTVAIKRILSREDDKGKEGFVSELAILSRCKHPNIVSLLGFCVEVDEMLLVFEHVSNGSLDDYLTSINTMSDFTWVKRLKMCIDIAEGLKYMHTSMDDRKGIIHRDLKSDNILLGKNWEAKIADFGLSKVHHMNQGVSTINTQTLAGTECYLDPEYSRTGRLKRASDIYSFGVILFEIFSGKLAYDSIYIKENEKGLAPIARRHFKSGTLKEILDPKLIYDPHEFSVTGKVEPNHDSLDEFARIAYQCVAKTQANRPTIEVVIEKLHKALHFQEAYEIHDAKLYRNKNEKEISKSLQISSAMTKNDIYNILSKRILLKDDKQELIRALQATEFES